MQGVIRQADGIDHQRVAAFVVIDQLAIGTDLWVRQMRNVEVDAAQLRSALVDQDDFVLPLQEKSGLTRPMTRNPGTPPGRQLARASKARLPAAASAFCSRIFSMTQGLRIGLVRSPIRNVT